MTRCPTPGKRPYESREAALFFARAQGNRAYQCRCGAWHLSSKGVQRPHAFRRAEGRRA